MFGKFCKQTSVHVLFAGLGFFAVSAQAKNCELSVESTDAMQYTVKELTVEKDCTEVKITLKHTGKLPKAAMGHNIVIATDKDMPGILADAAKAGVAKEFLPEGDKRIVAASKLIGGGETTSLSFARTAIKAGENYKFFCTFPGHSGLMQGNLKF